MMSKTIKRLFVIALMIFTLPIQAEIIALKPDAPERYIVVKGDTLWDIAGRFIGSPWKWPEIWHLNDQISNPHLIYPGDIIGLINIDGQTKLTVTQRGNAARTVKLNPDVQLSPTARIEPIEAAIPAIPLSAIEGYFKNHEILNKKEFKKLPYVVASQDKRVVMGAGGNVYVRGSIEDASTIYGIYRRGQVFKDPETKEFLGVEATDVGLGRIISQQDEISTIYIEKSSQQIQVGDVLLEASKHNTITSFVPQAPKQYLSGQLLAVDNGVAYIGQYNVVALNRGLRDGLEPGHVLMVKTRGAKVYDKIAKKKIRLPPEQAATMMVFRVFDKMSYALIMSATKPVRVGDFFESPTN